MEIFQNMPLSGTMVARRVFKTRHFARWMRKTELTDVALCKAVHEMTQGLVDADLGQGVVKKRVAVGTRGKRGGARTLVATNKNNRWFFLFGFEKNERANISPNELYALQELAAQLLVRTDAEIARALADDALKEICDEH